MKTEMINHDDLIKHLDYDMDSGLFTWKIPTTTYIKKGAIAGSNDLSDANGGYLRIGIFGRVYSAHRLAWFYVNGRWPEGQIDHINHKKADNRISNLRCVSNYDNQLNRPMHKNNKSGVVGVHWNKASKKWHAQIKHNGNLIYLGLFSSLDDAKEARISAQMKYGYHPNCGNPL